MIGTHVQYANASKTMQCNLSQTEKGRKPSGKKLPPKREMNVQKTLKEEGQNLKEEKVPPIREEGEVS